MCPEAEAPERVPRNEPGEIRARETTAGSARIFAICAPCRRRLLRHHPRRGCHRDTRWARHRALPPRLNCATAVHLLPAARDRRAPAGPQRFRVHRSFVARLVARLGMAGRESGAGQGRLPAARRGALPRVAWQDGWRAEGTTGRGIRGCQAVRPWRIVPYARGIRAFPPPGAAGARECATARFPD